MWYRDNYNNVAFIPAPSERDILVMNGFNTFGEWKRISFSTLNMVHVRDYGIVLKVVKEAKRRLGSAPITHGTKMKIGQDIYDFKNIRNLGWEAVMYRKHKLTYYGNVIFDAETGYWAEKVEEYKFFIKIN